MPWSDHMQDIAAACVETFDTDVLLPDGVTVVQGVFNKTGDPSQAPWSDVGQTVRLTQIDNPHVELLSPIAAGLAVGDRLVIDGAAYLVSAPPHDDGSHLTAVELRPEQAGADGYARWQ